MEEFSFKFLGNMPSFESILEIVGRIDEKGWIEYSDRKRFGGIAAEKTDTVPIIYNHNPLSTVEIIHPMMSAMSPYLDEVKYVAGEFFGPVETRQAMLTRLPPGAEIKRHKDRGPVTAKTHRVHLPVLTNSRCIFTVGDEAVHMKAGELWAIDNVGKYHSVSNAGESHRVHLIIDLIQCG